MPPTRRAWTAKEVAEQLGVHVDTVYDALKAGRLYGRRWNNQWLIPDEAITAFLDGKTYRPVEVDS